MLTDEQIDEVKQAADIVEVVSDRVKLKRSGNGFMGLCPFHNEKTPSFHVSPQLGIYKCFGCGKAGNVFTFVMEQEGVDFPESVRLLANRYNIPLPEKNEHDDPNRHEREGVFHALQFATAFYHKELRESDDAQQARGYLIKRGLKRDFIKEYQLGYSPDAWRGLADAAKSAGINEEYLMKAGLLKESDTGREPYDTFRGRVMFPIINTMGRVIAFGGRLMGVAKVAKYINSPQTLVYNKSEALYGIHVAKNEIRKHNEAILVEGYMDVLQLHQAGIKNVVSTSGTALTPQQMTVLNRYSERLLLIFDADNAGQSAMNRALPIALEEGLAVQVLTLPDGEDPDTFVKQFGKEGFLGYKRQHAVGFLPFLIEGEKQLETWDDSRHKKQVVTRALGLIAMIQDPIEREALIQQLHELTFIGDRTLFQELNQIILSKTRKERFDRKNPPAIQEKPTSTYKPIDPVIPEIQPNPEKIPIKSKSTPISAEKLFQDDFDSESVPPWLDDDIPLPDEDHRESEFSQLEDPIPLAMEEQQHQQTTKSVPKQPSEPEIELGLAPRYEEELIKLMLVHGEPLIAFVAEHITEDYFESPYCKKLFVDLKQRFIAEKDISITFYMTREHPFPMWVGQVLIDRHSISEKGQELLKANENEVLGPYKNAKSAMKLLTLSYSDRSIQELDMKAKLESDKTIKAKLTQQLSDWVRFKSRLLATSNEKLYPNPPWIVQDKPI